MDEQVSDFVEAQAIRRDLLAAFEYAHHEEDWVVPISQALSGVDAEEALWKPGSADPKGARCIWEIVLHMAVWTENVVVRMEQRKRGEVPGRPIEGDWPHLPAVRDEDTWAASQQQLRNALVALRTHIETTPVTALFEHGTFGYSQFDDVLCRLVHNAYHLGQITKLRDWYAAAHPGG